MTTTNFEEKALHLISFDSEEKLQINEEALKILRSIKGPIAVLGVAGNYRTGKSFLLNKVILNVKRGFDVGKTINPCTKGIWMWGKPLKGTTSDGQLVNVIVLDSEGLAAIDVDSNHDSRIFSLIMLLSSCFLYNSQGAIDEQALENISLIINLTKTIQIRSQGNSDVCFEDFQEYMPSFLWVLRDFSLELEDEYGEPLTSKDYLFKALKQQEGFSDQMERKNQIRKLISTFFKSKDCITMVRPVVDEEDLRNLQGKDLSELRHEFIEQALHLKKKVFSHAVIKSVNDQFLSGDMLASLAENYVNSLNSSSVPNIQNAWTYICKSKCQEALDESYQWYEEEIKNSLKDSWPLSQESLFELHNDIKSQTIKIFTTKAMGEDKEKYLKELQQMIIKNYEWLCQKNERDFEQIFVQSMQQFYVENLESKLNSQLYQNYFEYEKDMRNFQQYFLDSQPQGPSKIQLLLQFMLQKVSEAAQIFVGNLEEKSLGIENILKHEREEKKSEIGKKDQEIQDLREINEQKVKEYEFQLGDKKDKYFMMEEQLKKFKIESRKIEESLKVQKDEILKINKENVKKLTVEIQTLKDQIKDKNKAMILQESEFEKEKALLKQKTSFYEEQLENLTKNEKNNQNQVTDLRDEFHKIQKKLKKDFENQLENKKKEICILQERFTEQEEIHTKIKNDREQKIKILDKKNQDLITQLENLKNEIENGSLVKQKSLQDQIANSLREEMEEQLKMKNEDIQNFQKEVKNWETKYHKMIKQVEKEKAISNQKYQFLEQKCDTLAQQLKDAKKMSEDALNAIEYSQNEEKMDLSHQLQELTQQHKNEVTSYEKQLSNLRENMQQEINRLMELKDNLEFELEKNEEEGKKQVIGLRKRFEEADKERLSLKKEVQELSDLKEEKVGELEEFYQNKVSQLEEELEEIKSKSSQQYAKSQQQQEEYILQMKEMFEEERGRLEQRIQQDSQKYSQKQEEMQKEFQERMEKEEQYYEEEIEGLRNEAEQMRISFVAARNQLEEELKVKEQQNGNLNSKLENLQQNLQQIQQNQQSALQENRKKLEQELDKSRNYVEKLKQTNSNLEKENWQLKQDIDKIHNDMPKMNLKFTEKIEILTKEKEDLTYNLNEMREKLDNLNEQSTQQKIENSKELALSQQKCEFLGKRVQDLQINSKEQIQKLEQKLLEQKDITAKELKDIKDKYSLQLKQQEEKYEQKKKQLKENESIQFNKIRIQEQKLYDLSEQLQKINQSLINQRNNQEEERENHQLTLDQLKEEMKNLSQSDKEEIERLKDEKCNLEIEFSELDAAYEKDKALWQGKFSFQKEQMERLNQDLKDSKKNFDLMIAKLKRMRQIDTQEIANSQSMRVESLKQIHQAQLNEMIEKHKNQLHESQVKLSKAQKEIKLLNERLIQEKNYKIQGNKDLEKQLNLFIENEKVLRDKISKQKLENDKNMKKMFSKLEDQKSGFREKINHLEKEIRGYQTEKTKLIVIQEQNLRKFTIEKDQLLNEKLELAQEISSLRKKTENLKERYLRLQNENRKKKLLGNTFTSNLQGKFNCFLNNSKFQEKSFIAFESKIPSLNYKSKDKSSFLKDDLSEEDNILEKKSTKDNQFNNTHSTFLCFLSQQILFLFYSFLSTLRAFLPKSYFLNNHPLFFQKIKLCWFLKVHSFQSIKICFISCQQTIQSLLNEHSFPPLSLSCSQLIKFSLFLHTDFLLFLTNSSNCQNFLDSSNQRPKSLHELL